MERGLSEIKDTLVRMEAKLDGKSGELDLRVRALETRMAQVSLLGLIGTLVIGPFLGVLFTHLLR